MKKRTCDICGKDIWLKDYVDGKTIHGPWATMCISCHDRVGLGLGLGKGQRYSHDGKKIEG